MTNGEKLEQVFPDGICPFSKSWLDHEYKEPSTKINQDLTKNKSEISTGSTTKNDLGVDCISRAEAIRVASGYCHPSNVAKELAKLPSMGRYDPYTDKFIKE